MHPFTDALLLIAFGILIFSWGWIVGCAEGLTVQDEDDLIDLDASCWRSSDSARLAEQSHIYRPGDMIDARTGYRDFSNDLS